MITPMVFLIVVAAALFILGLLLGKRFGLPVLGLAAGLVIAQYFAATAVAVSTPYLSGYQAYVPAAITVLPSVVLLLFAKGRHRKAVPRVFSALAYAAAGLAFVLAAPLTTADISGSLPVATANMGLILTGLLALAVLEAAFGKPSKKKIEEPHK